MSAEVDAWLNQKRHFACPHSLCEFYRTVRAMNEAGTQYAAFIKDGKPQCLPVELAAVQGNKFLFGVAAPFELPADGSGASVYARGKEDSVSLDGTVCEANAEARQFLLKDITGSLYHMATGEREIVNTNK